MNEAPQASEAERDAAGGIPARVLVGMVRLYQKIVSPILPPSCIYYPTCSAYAITAIRRFGALRGCWLAFRRVMRCHPFRNGGQDPVPDKWENRR